MAYPGVYPREEPYTITKFDRSAWRGPYNDRVAYGRYRKRREVDDYEDQMDWLTIGSALLAFIANVFLGTVAIVFAYKSHQWRMRGDELRAYEYSRFAKYICIGAVLSMVLIATICGILHEYNRFYLNFTSNAMTLTVYDTAVPPLT